MEEYVLRGNPAVLKCHVPSFVAEFVSVETWLVLEGSEQLELSPAYPARPGTRPRLM